MATPVFILTKYNPGEGSVFKGLKNKIVSDPGEAQGYTKEGNANKQAERHGMRVVTHWRD